MNNWGNKIEVQKGNFAENIIKNFLESKGYVVYKPITKNAHAFDNLAIKNKKNVIISECKAKAKRTFYNDTGINISNYDDYKYISKKHNLPVFIFFVDEFLEEIYGNFLNELEKEVCDKGKKYPLKEKNIIYFPIMNMRRDIYKLNKEQVEYLKNKSKRNYDYELKTNKIMKLNSQLKFNF
ncbi:hypothetical protein ES703_44276 [subsurface metagenome]